MPTTDEPDRSPMPPQEAEDQPPPSQRSGARSAAIELHIESACPEFPSTSVQQLITDTQRVLALLPNSGSVRVLIVDDTAMTDAHKRYCDLESTTDVLTFDLSEGESDYANKVLDMDLIICADEAQRQAQQRSHPIVHELLLYIIHGVLHCLGHDDHDDADYARMHAREDELLTAAGIGAVFNATHREEPQS